MATSSAASASWKGNGGESLEQLFSRLRLSHKKQDEQPFLFLIQHSQSFQLRYQQHEQQPQQAQAVYRRAGLRTPAENARRDLHAGSLWLQHLLLLLVRLFEESNNKNNSVQQQKQQQTARVILVQTKPTLTQFAFSSLSQAPTIHVINLSQDPFGWDQETAAPLSTDKDSTKTKNNNINNLGQLDRVLETVRTAVRDMIQEDSDNTTQQTTMDNPNNNLIPIVLDSLVPILMRHGFQKTLHFLKAILNPVGNSGSSVIIRPLLLIPVPVESLSSHEHRVLEDLASAVLCLHQGEASFLRRGIRERENFVRASWSYDIIRADHHGDDDKYNQTGAATPIRIRERTKESGVNQVDDQELDRSNQKSTTPTTETQHNHHASNAKGRAKVQLKLEEYDGDEHQKASRRLGQTPVPPTPIETEPVGPRIFLQEDDPEFDDYDEEDPDEDLEI